MSEASKRSSMLIYNNNVTRWVSRPQERKWVRYPMDGMSRRKGRREVDRRVKMGEA